MTFITKQICTSYCRYRSHSPCAEWQYIRSVFVFMCQKLSNWNIYFAHYYHMCQKQTCRPVVHICLIFDMNMWGMYTHIYATYEITVYIILHIYVKTQPTVTFTQCQIYLKAWQAEA